MAHFIGRLKSNIQTNIYLKSENIFININKRKIKYKDHESNLYNLHLTSIFNDDQILHRLFRNIFSSLYKPLK